MDWRDLLISLFVYVCQKYKEELWLYCQRMSNNRKKPDFPDEEVITLYLSGIIQGRTEIREIYKYAQDRLTDRFPDLPSYAASVNRLNRFESLFRALIEHILKDCPQNQMLQNIRFIDSMPIIPANARRSSHAKAAGELADKGYCASKGIYCHGVKLHAAGCKRSQKLPVPEYT